MLKTYCLKETKMSSNRLAYIMCTYTRIKCGHILVTVLLHFKRDKLDFRYKKMLFLPDVAMKVESH